MKKHQIQHDFDWQRWTSDTRDLTAIEPIFAAHLVFNMLLIHEFEHALLCLKNEDCVWGPVHTSAGQEALAAAAMAALQRNDKIAGSHRAHHQFLAAGPMERPKIFRQDIRNR